MRIKKGDTVVIRTGRDRGTPEKPKTGRVLHVYSKSNQVIVEGVNMITRHTRKTQKNPKGGMVRKEAPIHRSNVALFCKACAAPTKVGFKVISDGGKVSKIRHCRKCGEAI